MIRYCRDNERKRKDAGKFQDQGKLFSYIKRVQANHPLRKISLVPSLDHPHTRPSRIAQIYIKSTSYK